MTGTDGAVWGASADVEGDGGDVRGRKHAGSDRWGMAESVREGPSTELVFQVLKFPSKVLFENVFLNRAGLTRSSDSPVVAESVGKL